MEKDLMLLLIFEMDCGPHDFLSEPIWRIFREIVKALNVPRLSGPSLRIDGVLLATLVAYSMLMCNNNSQGGVVL